MPLGQELGVNRSLMCWWKQQVEGRQKPQDPGVVLDPCERRVRELEKKVAELKGVIGQKTLELDIFAGAFEGVFRMRQTHRSRSEMPALFWRAFS